MIKIYTANRQETRNEVFVNGERLNPEPSQELYNHSPTGFEWAYGGSGPSQLALAILFDFTKDAEKSLKYHQLFKWDFIAPAPFEGFVITSMDIAVWLEQKEMGQSSQSQVSQSTS